MMLVVEIWNFWRVSSENKCGKTERLVARFKCTNLDVCYFT